MKLARLAWLLAALMLLPLAEAAPGDPNCPRPPNVPPGARYSCPTRTQTQQPGEPPTNHPGGQKGRGGDVFNSTGSPPTSPPTDRGDPNARSVHCQIEHDGKCHCGPRRAGTGRNRPCRDHGTAADTVAVFNYIYFNGINTPMGHSASSGRGTYLWDYHMIGNNLLDLHPGKRSGHPKTPQDGNAYRQPVRVADELDQLVDIGHNYSGTDVRAVDMVKSFCSGPKAHGPGMEEMRSFFCSGVGQKLADFVDSKRASGFFGMAAGDIFECVMQAHGVPVDGRFKPGGNIEWTAKLDEVQRVVKTIYDTLNREKQSTAKPKRKHHFIIIGHSQGNFFAEATGWYLMRHSRALFNERIAIHAFASPTSYDAIDDPAWKVKRFRYLTREDDAIVALGKIALPGQKVPLPANAETLWGWPVDNPIFMLADVVSLGPPPECNCPGSNGALYGPAMNSHLLDNYLTDPPMTEPGHVLNRTVLDRMHWQASPRTRSVLGEARRNIVELKASLLRVEIK
ncbi:hypothetical protein HLB44_08755 [Aquincola sp. S2]|uniref:DUF676 domain-containing protein n=1 Tax=Pseudaquabacterium terrae TaxID=2732868 RepID=A0ABX2EEM6_9BURK|nr:hypothetical protein [Aquabacterium terrae]NRF67068.1 hypothetical protein [Aquabacterium terrae]